MVKYLNQYFSICEYQKEQEQLRIQRMQLKTDQKQKIIEGIQSIEDKINQALKDEEGQKNIDLELQNHEEIQVDEERFTEDDDTEICCQISDQDSEYQDMELQLEIITLDQNLKDEQIRLQKQLEKDVNETYKHFDLTPESEKQRLLKSTIQIIQKHIIHNLYPVIMTFLNGECFKE
ncbi:hypothetical protein ABPG72_003254 [Tetrahymena utriculariae]